MDIRLQCLELAGVAVASLARASRTATMGYLQRVDAGPLLQLRLAKILP
jgi:hypothetical protein